MKNQFILVKTIDFPLPSVESSINDNVYQKSTFKALCVLCFLVIGNAGSGSAYSLLCAYYEQAANYPV